MTDPVSFQTYTLQEAAIHKMFSFNFLPKYFLYDAE